MIGSNRLSWLKNRKISTRFRLILLTQFTALLIIIIAILTIAPQLQNSLQKLNDAQNNLNISRHIESELLQTREHEQDFFLQSNLVLGESNINYLQYTNQINQLNLVLESLSQYDPDTTDLIQQHIDDYDSNYQQIVTSLIPNRQETLSSISTLFTELEPLVNFQSNSLVISNLSRFENSITIYQLQLFPNRNSYDEFQIKQPNQVREVKLVEQSLRLSIDIASTTDVAKTEMTNILADIMDLFDQLVDTDANITELVRRYQAAIHSVEPILSQLVEDANVQFSDENIVFINLIRSRVPVIIALVTISTLTLMILIPLITRSIEEPIELLAEATQSISSGNYEQKIAYKSNDEIGQLATSFNQMSDAIKRRNIQLNEALEEAHEANRLKDEFLATMSHELRTPLNAIIGFLGIVQMTADLGEKNTHRLERASVNSERLLALINNILDISRIEAGRMKITKTSVNIRTLIADLQSQLEILIEDKGIKFNLEVDKNLPDEIITDEDAITKIITNLSGNAMKFTEQGEVRINIKADNARDKWVIEVSDTGIGIPIHMQEAIFDRFRQVDGSSTREYGGSGLGLAIVSGLCREMNGTVTVDSEIGQGSTFRITLPLEVTEKVIE